MKTAYLVDPVDLFPPSAVDRLRNKHLTMGVLGVGNTGWFNPSWCNFKVRLHEGMTYWQQLLVTWEVDDRYYMPPHFCQVRKAGSFQFICCIAGLFIDQQSNRKAIVEGDFACNMEIGSLLAPELLLSGKLLWSNHQVLD